MVQTGAAADPASGGEAARAGSGRWIVACLIMLGLAAAVTGIAFQRLQTRRCLAFYGPRVARRITSAPRVEVWRVRPTADGKGVVAFERVDASRAGGLVHLRRGLVEDANFDWQAAVDVGRLADDAWDLAFVFSEPGSPGGHATLVIDLDDGGSLAVVGQPGRVRLGRIARGLEKWIAGL